MSQLSETMHNLGDLMAGKATFAQVRDEEVAMFKADVAKLPAAVQPAVNLTIASLEAGMSALVGIGLTAAGPVLAEATDTQATQVLNILSALGVPTAGPLSLAEHAVLVQVINGLKAGLDHAGLRLTTVNGVKAPAA